MTESKGSAPPKANPSKTEVVQVKGDKQFAQTAPVVQVHSDRLPSKDVHVVGADGTFGTVSGENLTTFLQDNPGATIAPADMVARKDAELAEAKKELADPYGYQEQQYMKREAEVEAADAQLGLPGQIMGGLFALSPMGPAVLAGAVGSAALPGGALRNPLPALARTQYGLLDPGGLTSAAIAGSEVFAPEADTKAFLDKQTQMPGYATGQALGTVAGVGVAGKAAGALGRAAFMGLEGASREATGAWLQDKEVTVQKMAMAGMLNASMELAPMAAGAAVEGAAKGVRRFGAFSEALSGDTPHFQEAVKAVKAAGQDPVAYRDVIVNNLRTPEAIVATRNNLQGIISRETQAVAEIVRGREAIEASRQSLGVPVKEVFSEVENIKQNLRSDLEAGLQQSPSWQREVAKIRDPRVRAIVEERARKSFYENWAKENPGVQEEIAGANKFLVSAMRAADPATGSLTQDALAKLKSSIKSGNYTPVERRGAAAVAKRIEGRLVEALADSDPSKFGDLKAMQKQLDLHTTLWNITKDAAPNPIPGVGEATKNAIRGSSLSTLLGYSAIFNGHIPHGFALLGAKAIAGEAFNAARRLVPNAIVGEQMARSIRAVNTTVQEAARGLAISAMSQGDLQPGSKVKTLPSREEFDNAVAMLQDRIERPADIGGLRYVDEGLYEVALASQRKMAENSMSQLSNLPQARGKGPSRKAQGAHLTHGALGGLLGEHSTKPKQLQPSEILAWDYIKTVLDPIESIRAMGTHRASPQTLRALEENYPDVLAQFQDSLLQEIQHGIGEAKVVSLDQKAYLARVLGRPVDVTTDPAFAAAVQTTKTVPSPPSPSPAVEQGRAEVVQQLQTQAERNETR